MGGHISVEDSVSYCVPVPARWPTNRFNEKPYARSCVMHGLLWVETVCIGRRLKNVCDPTNNCESV
jgi:hypothetical protein